MTTIQATILIDQEGNVTIEAAGHTALPPGRYQAVLSLSNPAGESAAPRTPRRSVLDGFPIHHGLRLLPGPDGKPPTFSREEMYDDDGR